ncbi:hypothetical protein DYB32_009014 [Aphanomyces invadans]|uniref:Uncharacterized protein n=1 Tax=Aphanomyces invadans TaxID=157072 RepID=A0A418AJJ9_9STRA|nr:hypothetical protein DYB32_009014 [Aphanomyces invadans]
MEAMDSAPPRPVARIVGRGEHVVDENGKVHEDTPIGSYKRTGGNWRKIYWDDLFHTIINTRTSRLAEAHVRCYAVRHEFDVSKDGVAEETALFQTHHMRLQQPDDDIGAFLLMALPQVVVRTQWC